MPKNKNPRRRNSINRKLTKDLESRMDQFRGFGDLALYLRQQVDGGIVRTALAKRMGYSHTHSFSAYIHQVENGQKHPSAKLMNDYASYFQIPKKLILKIYSVETYAKAKERAEKDISNITKALLGRTT